MQGSDKNWEIRPGWGQMRGSASGRMWKYSEMMTSRHFPEKKQLKNVYNWEMDVRVIKICVHNCNICSRV